MATPMRGRIAREVQGARRAYTVEIVPAGVIIREKGTRTAFGPVSWDAIYSVGAKQEVVANGGQVPGRRPGRRRGRR